MHTYITYAPDAVSPYQAPFEDMVGQRPSLDLMKDIVVTRKLRPTLPAAWGNHQVCLCLCIFLTLFVRWSARTITYMFLVQWYDYKIDRILMVSCQSVGMTNPNVILSWSVGKSWVCVWLEAWAPWDSCSWYGGCKGQLTHPLAQVRPSVQPVVGIGWEE